MNVKDTLQEEKTRRIALAPVCMVLHLAMEHVPDDYIVARMAHKQMAKWVGGGSFDPVLRMRPTLHDEVARAHRAFDVWDKLPANNTDTGDPKARGPLYTFAALRCLENAVTAGLNGDEGDLGEAIDDLDEIPVDPPVEKKDKGVKKTGAAKIKVVREERRETLADLLRSLGEVLSVRPLPRGQSKAS